MTPDPGEILAWNVSLAGPVRVVYEAGSTGFGASGAPRRGRLVPAGMMRR